MKEEIKEFKKILSDLRKQLAEERQKRNDTNLLAIGIFLFFNAFCYLLGTGMALPERYWYTFDILVIISNLIGGIYLIHKYTEK